jgi:hypothetical protein
MQKKQKQKKLKTKNKTTTQKTKTMATPTLAKNLREYPGAPNRIEKPGIQRTCTMFSVSLASPYYWEHLGTPSGFLVV